MTYKLNPEIGKIDSTKGVIFIIERGVFALVYRYSGIQK